MNRSFWLNHPNEPDDISQGSEFTTIGTSDILLTDRATTADCAHQAAFWSQQVFDPEQQWQVYLHRLALFGLEAWLQERDPHLQVRSSQTSLLQPEIANVMAAVARLQVGEFQLCLIATGAADNSVIALPRAVVELPDYAAHFYLVMEVLEEQGLVRPQGFLSYAQLQHLQGTEQLSPQADWFYHLPTAALVADIDQLLLYLQCLQPTVLAVPETIPNVLEQTSVRTWLKQLPTWAVQLQERPLWQLLSWEQGAVLLSQPQLLRALYDYQKQSQTQALPAAVLLADLGQQWQTLTQTLFQQWQTVVATAKTAINQTIQHVQQGFEWLLLPNLDLAPSGLRSWQDATVTTPVAELGRLLQKLQSTGLAVTPKIQAGYQDVTLADVQLRLYAATWPMLANNAAAANLSATEQGPAEWGRLLIVSRTPSESLPENLPGGLKLEVFNCTHQPREQVVCHQISPTAPEPYLYVYFLATWAEEIEIFLSLVDGTTLSIPPLAIEVNSL